ncbi:putative peptidase family-domain-containing protein [Lipomyces arxii]|uniref:putative peptidase family-domain-containing protein n=1 Tax=Lipomyces arxii TaxID=56418 RepID=UPI0034CDB356
MIVPVEAVRMPPVVPLQSHPGTQRSGILFHNVSQGSNLYQRVVLIHGGAGPANTRFDAAITVHHHLGEFPPQTFPVSDGYFKALVHLSPGENNLMFTFAPGNLGGSPCSTPLKLNYVPMLQNAPLHLAIMVARDSNFTFDSPDKKKQQEGNDLGVAIKKLRMAGYLWQAFTGEQMARNGMGRRTFRLDEHWLPDTLSKTDSRSRMTAKVHIIRSDKTMHEIRDPDVAQQNKSAKRAGDLFGYALDAIAKHGEPFGPTPAGQETHIAVLILDSHYDSKTDLVQGHAALGGGSGHVKLAIFGSHALHSWPKSIEEVVPAFMDADKPNLKQVAHDMDRPYMNFQCAEVGIGAMLHEVGHLLGCPHQPSGIMLRGYTTLRRSFITREVQLNGESKSLCLPNDECAWHRLDLLRFRCHPMFRLASEPLVPREKPMVYVVENGVIVTSSTGIYLIEIHCDGWCRAHLEYPDGPQREVFLYEGELRSLLPKQYQDSNKPIKLEILALGESQSTIENFSTLAVGSKSEIGRSAVFDSIIDSPGWSTNSTKIRVLFRKILRVTIYHGAAVDGLEFFFDSGSAMFGKRGGSPSDFVLEATEHLVGLHVRTGLWVDAVQLITNLRRSAIYGHATGGTPADLIAPRGYNMIGVHGTADNWLTTVGIIYSDAIYGA